jgi:myo-inositol 2-dehydrogenase/D-chiro-inositol 1-dehydrogenase
MNEKHDIEKPSQAHRVSRRQFLGRSAAAVAAPYVLTSSALGAAGRAAASERITVGMIGMGRQATYSNVRFFMGQGDCQVVSVCDVDGWRLDRAQKQVDGQYAKQRASGTYKGCGAHRDFREVLARGDIDAVMISSPDHWHIPHAVAAAEAGKDICCEKPLTLCIAEGRALCEAVRRNGRVFRTDSEFRSHWFFHRACELVRNGRIGKVHTIKTGVPKGDVGCAPQPNMPIPKELDYDLWLGPAPVSPYTKNRVHTPRSYARPGWMRVRDYCEGMITNWGTHLNDIAQWGNGTERTGPVEVEATGTYPTDGLWNVLLSFEAKYRFAGGVRMIYKNTAGVFVRFEGTDGWIQADYGRRSVTSEPASIAKSVIGPDELHLPLLPEKRDFLDACKTRRPTVADAEVGHRTCSLCQLAHISIQVGRPLKWDPDAERFLNDPEADRLLTRGMRSPWHV